MKILQVTAHYSPNVGGVETHLQDLVAFLEKKQQQVFILTYRPLTTRAYWRFYEKKPFVSIVRLPWIPGLFYKLVHNPILEFLYLLPGLFLATPFILLFWRPHIIHAHGLAAGASSLLWAKLWRKRFVISLHSVYHFPKEGLYRNFVIWLFKNSDVVLTLSKQSAQEVISLGIPEEKVTVFTYWIDLSTFRRVEHAKKRLGLENIFVVLFVGRLVEEKGVLPLLESIKHWNKNVVLLLAGTGPLESKVKDQESKMKSIRFAGRITNEQLPLYYSAADVLIVPSVHEEGFGRVIIESLACGTPVIAANRGGIKEALHETVGYFISITPDEITKCIDSVYKNKSELQKKSQQAHAYAKKYFSEANGNVILEAYKK